MTPSILSALTLAPVVIGAVLAVTVDAFGGRRQAVVWAALGLVAAAVVSAYASATSQTSIVWGVLRAGGGFSAVAAVITMLAAVAILGGWEHLTGREWGGSLAGLMTFGAGASVLVAQSSDITLLLIALETAAACAYAIVASGQRPGSREAALKYFVQGAIATGLFLVGTAVVVGAVLPTGDLGGLRVAIASRAIPTSVLSATLVLLLGALAFKAGAAPFHSWAPDAYESSAPVGAAFLASAAKVGAVVALTSLAVLSATDVLEVPLTYVLVALAVLSILIGSVAALRQRSYTRMLGYAGVAQVGYALIAVAMSHATTLPTFFIVSYAIASTGTFLAAAAFRDVRPDWDGSIAGLAGLGRQAPVLAISASLLVISLAGIPPLLGFWAKFGAFFAAFISAGRAFQEGRALIAWVSVVAGVAGIVGSVVSLGYYGAVLRALFQAESPAETDPMPEDAEYPERGHRSRAATGAVVALAALVVVLGLVPLAWGLTALLRVFA